MSQEPLKDFMGTHKNKYGSEPDTLTSKTANRSAYPGMIDFWARERSNQCGG
jgi:hypothetical protein